MKLSVVDVKCQDEAGRIYVVEMQVLNVEAFEKRMVYNTSKAYVMQLPSGEAYVNLAPVVGVTICDFVFWPVNGDGSFPAAGVPVPMLSRWHVQEQQSGVRGFSDVQYSFLELPKYAAGAEPVGTLDRWAYLFREAENFTEIPPALRDPPFCEALEIARTANFTPAEWDAYDLAKMAKQDARGVASLARKEGLAKGEAQGLAKGEAQGLAKGEAQGLAKGEARGYAEAILRVAESHGITLDAKSRQPVLECQDMARLRRLFDKVLVASSASEILAELEKAD